MKPDQHDKSEAMLLFRCLGMEHIAWSLRRTPLPGSQGGPGARSGRQVVIHIPGQTYPLDAYVETRQRHWEPLKIDRPMVLGFIERLPFKSGSFDFLIASHVLEHSPYPEKALAEFQRVARAGYIEVPDAFFERDQPLS